MTDHRDELELLRAADPVRPDELPESDSPNARALLARLTEQPLDGSPSARGIRRLGLLTAAAAAIAAAVVGVVLLGGDEGSPVGEDEVAIETTTTTTAAPVSPPPITPGVGNCVEQYSLESLARRDAAFDGTVVVVEGDVITFDVNEWYRGGSSARTTRRGASTLGGVTSAGEGIALEPGTRLLVAGDDDFAWACGFTQTYDAELAESWRSAFDPG